MTRVALLAASGQLGGAERMVLECAHAWRSLGATAIVAALEDGPLLIEARRQGFEAEALAFPQSLARLGDAGGGRARVLQLLGAAAPLPRLVRDFGRWLDARDVDVVHSHGIKTHVLAALARRPGALIWHLHDYIGARRLSVALLKRLARRVDLVVAVSHSVADDARRWLPRATRLETVWNAVDTDRFSPEGAVAGLDALAGLPAAAASVIRVGLPATFASWKGHDIFLRALALLTDAPIRGYVIGGPLYRTDDSQWSVEALRGRIGELGLAGRVGITGFCDDMPAAYRGLDVVVHASTRPEPFGLVIAEAMSCGRFVIAVRNGGASEVFEDGVSGIGLSVADVATLRGALAGVLDDPSRRASIAATARDHAVERFGRGPFTARLEHAVTSVVSGLPSSRTSP